MKKIKINRTRKIVLRKLNLKTDVSKKYLNWMNDKEIQQYTEQKYNKHSITDIRNFVKEKNKSKTELLYGIFLNEYKLNTHIGNIKIGQINFRHKSAEIIILLEKKIMGKRLHNFGN
jgi:hypothetical protein